MAYDPSEFKPREGPMIPPRKSAKSEDKAATEDTKGAPRPKRYAKGGGVELRGKTKGTMR